MSRPFVAFYPGSYQKKTQHLDTLMHGAYFLLLMHCWTHGAIPSTAPARAAIARLPLRDWKKIAPVIDQFFDEEGRNMRATEELEKAERVSIKRSIAGRSGGIRSGISKAIASGKRSKPEANAKQTVKQAPKQNLKQTTEQNASNCEALQSSKITTSESLAARDSVDVAQQSGGSLATAHLESALREPPSVEDGANPLIDSLGRLATARSSGHPPGRPHWVSLDTPEWAAHQHWRQSRAWKPLPAITRIVDGVEQQGQWCDRLVPLGYDVATGERHAAKDEESAA